MFSLFGKQKPEPTQTEIHLSVGAKLKPETSFPEPRASKAPASTISCEKLHIQGTRPNAKLASADHIPVREMAVLINGISDSDPVALMNIKDKPGFDFWRVNKDREITQKLPMPELYFGEGEWVQYYFHDVACLANRQLLIGVAYHTPKPKFALYRFDITTSKLYEIEKAEPHTRNLDQIFEHLAIDGANSLVRYYSDKVRKSAEIYHNYYNHIRLFSTSHPEGLKVLKLGIDQGNIQDWMLRDKTLYLHTQDNRDNTSPKNMFWSLDLSKVLNG